MYTFFLKIKEGPEGVKVDAAEKLDETSKGERRGAVFSNKPSSTFNCSTDKHVMF